MILLTMTLIFFLNLRFLKIISGNLSIVKYFVKEKKVGVIIKDNNGQIQLHLASWDDHLNVVEYLVNVDKFGKDVAKYQKRNNVI